jgi:hypothetical protein
MNLVPAIAEIEPPRRATWQLAIRRVNKVAAQSVFQAEKRIAGRR